MNILPTPSGPSSRGNGAQRVRDAAKPAAARPPAADSAAEEAQDQAEISSAALELQSVSNGDAPAIAPERLRSVLGRIANGTYDRQDVLAQVAARIARDLGIGR